MITENSRRISAKLNSCIHANHIRVRKATVGRINQQTKGFSCMTVSLSNVCLRLTDSVKQLSPGAVLQEEVHSWSFLPMAKEAYNVGVFEHL